MRMRSLGVLVGFLLLSHAPTRAGETLTQADLLLRMIDLDRLSKPPAAGEQSLLFSSFDRASKEVESGRFTHWDANNDAGNFQGKTADGWDILADAKGPGVVWHIWSGDPAGTIRITLDGTNVIDAPFTDLFTTVAPFTRPEPQSKPAKAAFVQWFAYRTSPSGGYNLYFPIGFAKSATIATRGFSGHYQIDATTLPAGTNVATFTPKLDDAAEDALKKLQVAFRKGLAEKDFLGSRKTRTEGQQADLGKDEKLTWDVDKPGTIRALYVTLTDNYVPRELYFWHNVILRAWWDGHAQPDIEAPAAELFGSGFNRRSFRGVALGTDLNLDVPFDPSGQVLALYCYFPMPLFKSARVELENRTGRKIGLMLQMRIENAPPAADALQFHARYHVEFPAGKFDQTLLEATGRGRFVGCTYSVDTPSGEWWGEGDHKATIDGAEFPQIWGTGAADYFGDAPPLTPFGRPFHAVTLSGPYGKNSACRLQIADALVFQKSIRFAIENWSLPGSKLEELKRYVSSVAYWYADNNSTTTLAQLKPEDLDVPALRIPGAVEIEGAVQKGAVSVVKDKNEVGVEFSGGQAVRINGKDAVVTINLKSEKAGQFKLKLRMHPTQPFESLEVADADGKSIGLLKWNKDAHGNYEVGTVNLKAGDNPLRVKASGLPILDCWIVEPAAP